MVAKSRYWSKEDADSAFLDVGLEPLEPYQNIHHARLTQCSTCGEAQKKSLQMISSYNYGCVYCNGKRVRPADAEALLLKKHGRALEPFPGSSKPWRVACTRCDREYAIRYKDIRLEHRKGFCKPCAGLQLSPEFVASVMEKAKLEPLSPYPGSMKSWPCRCIVCNQEVAPLFMNVRRGHGCLHCERKRLGEAQRKPPDEQEVRSRNLEPLEPYPGQHSKWRCRCLKCGQEVFPRWGSVVGNGGDGCIKCGARARGDRQFRNHDEVVAEMLAAGVKPLDPYPGSSEPWRCECQRCGQIVMTRYVGIQRGERGCIDCGNASSAAARKLPDEAVTKFMRDAGYEPIEPYRKSNAPWRCIHIKCGNVVTPSYATIQQGNGGCRACAENGIDYTAPAILYLLISEYNFSLKVGITSTNSVTDRIAQHLRRGWDVVATWTVRDGFLAEDVEQALIRFWRHDRGAPASVPKEAMPQGGYTETASLLHVDIDESSMIIESMLGVQ